MRHLSCLTKSELLLTLEIVSACINVQTDADFIAILHSLQELVPAEKSISLVTSVTFGGHFIKIINATFPTHWVSHYLSREYSKCDPVLHGIFAHFAPQIWSKAFSMASTLQEVNFIQRAGDCGLYEGITIGLPDKRRGIASILSFEGRHLAEHNRHASALCFLLPHLHLALTPRAAVIADSIRQLSDRELEVLKWIKIGKTNWEISQILHISERTVKFHIANAMEKLNASTRAHALAIALKQGLIDI